MNKVIKAKDASITVEVVERQLHRVFNTNTALSMCRGILDELDFEVQGMPKNNRKSKAREDGQALGRLIVRMAETGTFQGGGDFLREVKRLLVPIVTDRIKRWEAMKEHEKVLQEERKRKDARNQAA